MLLKRIRSCYRCLHIWFRFYKSFYGIESWSWQTRHSNSCNPFNSHESIKHRKIKFREKNGDVDKKIPDTSGLVTTTVLNIKISEVEDEILDNSKYITTQIFNSRKFGARLKQAHLVNKADFDNKLTRFNKRITSNKTKYLEVKKN